MKAQRMRLTFAEKKAMRDVLRTFQSCAEFDEHNQNYVDGGNFTLAMDKHEFDNLQSGIYKFCKFTLSDAREFKKIQSKCKHEFSMIDRFNICLKCGFQNTIPSPAKN